MASFELLAEDQVWGQVVSPSVCIVEVFVLSFHEDSLMVLSLPQPLSNPLFDGGCSPEYVFSLGQFKHVVESFPGFQIPMHFVFSPLSKGESKDWDLEQSSLIGGMLVTLVAGFLPSTLPLAFADMWLLPLSSNVNGLSLVQNLPRMEVNGFKAQGSFVGCSSGGDSPVGGLS